MRKGTYSFIEQTLLDYNEIDKHIKNRVEEITYPVSIPDDNIGGSSAGTISNPTERLAVTIMDDMLISNLKHTKNVVDEVLEGLRIVKILVAGFGYTEISTIDSVSTFK